MTIENCQIDGRTVWIAQGTVSQTINICTADNERGQYAWIIRIPSTSAFVTRQEVEARRDTGIAGLIEWLLGTRNGKTEKTPTEVGEPLEPQLDQSPVESSLRAFAEDDHWIAQARRITEQGIDRLLNEFLQNPYMHRVEHSIHARLFGILASHSHLNTALPLASDGRWTQPIHKEWPEVRPRPEKVNRRGLFDLAILPPMAIKNCSPEDFEKGLVRPPIAIEVGLNYGEGHLMADLEKLLNSEIQHGYLVHLIRDKPFDFDRIKSLFQAEAGRTASIKVAVAAIDRKGKVSVQRLADTVNL